MLSSLIVTGLFIVGLVGYITLAKAKGWGMTPSDGYDGGDIGGVDGGDGGDGGD